MRCSLAQDRPVAATTRCHEIGRTSLEWPRGAGSKARIGEDEIDPCFGLVSDPEIVKWNCKDEDVGGHQLISKSSNKRACISLIHRELIAMNLKKLRRLFGEEKLQVRKRSGRKQALGHRGDQFWSLTAQPGLELGFVSDAFTDGRRFRMLTVVDDHTRECLALVADTSLSGGRVVRELDAIIAGRGQPLTVVSDNGTEFTNMAILRWS